MVKMLYRRADNEAEIKAGGVIHWETGIIFRCPCNEREVYVTSPHTISFANDGLLTLGGSVGYHENETRPQNWCHFWIKNGVPKMCKDAQCPGRH